MTTITQIRSDLTDILLVACDQSYRAGANADPPTGNPISVGDSLSSYPDSIISRIDLFPRSMPDDWRDLSLGDWIVQSRFDEPTTGFGATLYRKSASNGLGDYIVAMQGTRGPNIQDWAGNLIYGWDKWTDERLEGGQQLLNDLLSLKDVNHIHFTGQSLGGALAEYALYDYAQLKSDFDPAKVTLTTFNGLGGIAALEQYEGPVDGSLVSSVDTAHFYITNDLVSRFGAGHLNGAGNEYLLDFAQTDTPGTGLILRRDDGTAIAMDPFTVHRIETGFYSGFNRAQGMEDSSWPSAFAEAKNKPISPLHVEELARVGSYVAWLTNQDGAPPTKTEAWARAIAATTYSLAFGDGDELKTLSDAFIDSLYASDEIPSKKLRDFAKVWIPRFASALAGSPSGVSTHFAAQYIALLAELSSTSAKVEAQEGLASRAIELIGGANLVGAPPKFSPEEVGQRLEEVLQADIAKSRVEALYVKAAAFSLLAAVFAVPSVLQSAKDATLEAVAVQTGVLAGDAVAFAREALQAVAQAFASAGEEVVDTLSRALVESSRALSDAAVHIVRASDAFGIDAKQFFSSEEDSIAAGLAGVAQSLANAYDGLTLKFTDAFEWGSSLSRFALASVARGLEAEAGAAPEFELALGALEFALQSAVIRPGRSANPFDSASFGPDASPVSVGSLAEGSVRTFTLYLPYEAGTGGQRVQLALAGGAADRLALLDDAGETALGADGAFTLVVPEGRRELSFGLWAKGDVDAGAALALSAQLADGTGAATHLGHVELNLALEGVLETPPVTGREIRGDWAPKPYLDPATGKTTYKTDDLFNIERLVGVPSTGDVEVDQWLDGSAGADHIVTGDFDEQARGGGGEDFIVGSDNTGNILFGGAGADRIEGGGWTNHSAEFWEWVYLGRPMGLGDDKIYGGAGDDQIWGESEATQGALADANEAPTGITGDWLTGGGGADRVYGSAGDDVLLGGTGDDLLVGGAGMDVLLGDDDYQIRPTGNYWRVVHPNFGDATPGFGGFELGLFPVVNAADAAPEQVWAVSGDPYFAYYRFGGGDDVLIGGAGRDILIGQFGDDTLYGGADDDILAGWEGNDELLGGAGDDLMAGDFGRYEQTNQRWPADTLLVPAGVIGTGAAWGSQVDLVGNDLLDGGAGNDVLYGEGGDDSLAGGDGNDTLYGDAPYLPEDLHGKDVLDGGAGDDTLYGDAGDDQLSGESGDDLLDGGRGNDLLDGGEGDDRLRTGDGDDALYGGYGNDELRAGAGDDSLYGDEGDDALYGEAGDDALDGGDGNDLIVGGLGSDVLRGGAGDDTYVLGIGQGRDAIDDLDGANRIRFGAGVLAEDVRAALDSGTLVATLTYSALGDAVSFGAGTAALAGIDFADGGSWTRKQLADALPALVADGSSAGETLEGRAGLRNALHGGGGDDALFGDAYDDLLDGGDGSDSANGWKGSDTYYYAGTETGVDRIEDFATDTYAYLDAYYAALGITDWEARARSGDPAALPAIAPLVERGDTAAIDALVAAGTMARDVVRFGPGVALADLALRVTVPGASADAHPDEPWRDGGTLSVRWAQGGIDLEVPDARYGFTGSSLPAEPYSYALGAGSEAIEFDDGAAYSLEEVLAQASVLPVFGEYHVARGSGLHAIDAAYEAIVFDDSVCAWDVQVSRADTDLVLALDDGTQARIAGWYGARGLTPPTALRFSYDAGMDAAALTAAGLEAHGGDGNDVMDGLDGYADALYGEGGSDLIEARGGDDRIDVRDRALVIGGAGDDRIDHYGEAAVIAFNPGDGNDTVHAAGALTLSIGGGVAPGDLTLAQDGADLLLGVAGAGSIRLTREGEDDPAAWPEITLQLFGSVHLYDFNAALEMSALPFGDALAVNEISFSESAGLGGAIAWRYATTGSTGSLTSEELSTVLADPRFATAPQPIEPAPPNRPPVLAQPLANQSAVEGKAFVFALPAAAFSDPDPGDALAFGAALVDGSALPAWLAFDPASATFSGTPGFADAGSYLVRVTATDSSGASASAELALDVAEGAPPPVEPGDCRPHGKHREDRDHRGHEPSDERSRSHNDQERHHDPLAERLARPPHFDFEAIAREFESGKREEKALSSAEIRGAWERVARHAAALGSGGDDFEHGAAWRGAGEFLRIAPGGGHGFGFDASIGAGRAPEGFKSFEGLREGFRRL